MTDPTNDPFEADLAARLRAVADATDGSAVTRAGVDAAVARRRSLQRRRLAVVAAAAVVAAGGLAAGLAPDDEPAQVRSTGATTTAADPPATSTPIDEAEAECPIAEVEYPGLVRLTEFQIQVLIEAELVDPATVFAARRGPVPITDAASEALVAGGVGLDGEQLLARGYDIAGIERRRDAQGVYTGYVCPDGSEHTVATTTPSTTTTTEAAAPTTVAATPTTPTGSEGPGPTTTTSLLAPSPTTVPAPTGQILSADLEEGQRVWAVYVDAISLIGPPIGDHTRAAEAEDRWFDAQAVLRDAGYLPELVPLPCDGAAAVARVLPVLPDGPADADADDVYVMGAYFLDEPSARAAASTLGADVLAVVDVAATCVDAPGPRGYQH